ncbi:hypothetical protein IWX48DRAFT_601592 [Phyllosticta citricarpa]
MPVQCACTVFVLLVWSVEAVGISGQRSFDGFCDEVIPVMLEKQTTTELSNLKKVLGRARKKEKCAAASLKHFASQKNGHRFVLP